MPQGVAAVTGLEANIRLQDKMAQTLKKNRYNNGALELETIEVRPVFAGEELKGFDIETENRAKDLIAEFMIAANGVTSRYLIAKKFPSIQRVVRKPKRWDRIVGLAAEQGYRLPMSPDSKALEKFLVSSKATDPLHFPDLSLSVIKLLGAGEYVVQMPGENSTGHFGLAVAEYNHSTAPNRRYPDIITQRLLKAALAGNPSPYGGDELGWLATHCTEAESAANKVERQVRKSAAALLLESKIGQTFDAIVTGAAEHGTYVRILNPPVEGKLEQGYEGMDVGQRLRVQLISTDVERGFIDFKRVNNKTKS
jgi:exoribonuclease-2